MPRKQNYSFERTQRERAKAAKQEAKREMKGAAKAAPTDDEAATTDDLPSALDRVEVDEPRTT